MRKGLPFLFLAALGALAYFQTPSTSGPIGGTFTVDSVHSNVVFRITHVGVSAFYGSFNKIEGEFDVAEDGTGSVSITIDATSVDSNNEKRNQHLMSPDFLSTEQFPEITFKGKLAKAGDGYTAKGMLELHGVSKEITVPLKRIGTADVMGGLRTGFEGQFTISRKAYGMNWRPEALGDEITIIVGIEGIAKK
jgi:polyisoprenoid-binding protein YceI